MVSLLQPGNARIFSLKKALVPLSSSNFRLIALATKNILVPFQTGVRKSHNTQIAPLKLTDDIWVGRENRHATLLLQFDFNKAFDKISPPWLLTKLMGLGFSKVALSWFWLYLCECSHCVFSRFLNIEYRNINLGVPQGSVFGPFYFVYTLMTS